MKERALSSSENKLDQTKETILEARSRATRTTRWHAIATNTLVSCRNTISQGQFRKPSWIISRLHASVMMLVPSVWTMIMQPLLCVYHAQSFRVYILSVCVLWDVDKSHGTRQQGFVREQDLIQHSKGSSHSILIFPELLTFTTSSPAEARSSAKAKANFHVFV